MSQIDERPTPPEDYECCQSECSPCVWDAYYEALNEWNARQQAEKAKAAESEASE